MSHIRLERTIWPVGHGAFYTEQFKDEKNHVLFTAVYDCGSEQLKTLRKCIDEFLAKDNISKIDALFISHFHYDHVNALDYLLSKIRVDNLFIPQLTDDYILSILGTSTYIRTDENQSPALDILQRLYRGDGLENVNHIYEVPQVTEENLPEAEYREQDYRGVYKYKKAPLFIPTLLPFWTYLPCNIFAPSQALIDEFVAQKFGEGKGNVDLNAVFDALKQGKWKKIQAIYQKVFPNSHNEYSMTVYSGLARNAKIEDVFTRAYASPIYYWDRYYPWLYPSRDFNGEVGCLYTGDFEAKAHARTLKRFYIQNFGAWSRVAMLQIPHHGSYNNYDDELYDFSKFTFASVAVRDKYGHPHMQTLTDISNRDCPVSIVQNNKATALITIYNFEI